MTIREIGNSILDFFEEFINLWTEIFHMTTHWLLDTPIDTMLDQFLKYIYIAGGGLLVAGSLYFLFCISPVKIFSYVTELIKIIRKIIIAYKNKKNSETFIIDREMKIKTFFLILKLSFFISIYIFVYLWIKTSFGF